MVAFLEFLGLDPTALGDRGVAGLFTLIGLALTGSIAFLTWFGNKWINLRNARRLREEKSRDIQTALLAEIEAIVQQWTHIDVDQTPAGVRKRFAEARDAEENYTPYVTAETGAHIFLALIDEITVLEDRQIRAVVNFYRQIHVIEKFADDLKSQRFYDLDLDRKERMVLDYLKMINKATEIGAEAAESLTLALNHGRWRRKIRPNTPTPGGEDAARR